MQKSQGDDCNLKSEANWMAGSLELAEDPQGSPGEGPLTGLMDSS